MGKYGKYLKHYKRSWEMESKFKGWLQPNNNNNNNKEAYCTVCKKSLRAQKNDLLKHSDTKAHRDNFERCNPPLNQKPLTEVIEIKNMAKEEELIISAFIAVHSSVNSVDHLSEVINKTVDTICKKTANSHTHTGTDTTRIRLHRTKCTMIIKNVISETLKEELVEEIGDKPFSLIVDESTDVSIFKYLALCVRYFSDKLQKINTTFLGLVKVESATAQALCDLVLAFLEKLKLNVNNMIGLGTDGANNVCGLRNSLYTRLHNINPKIQLVKCTAHSLHLCCQKAAECLPSSLDFLCQEIYNWFSKSSLRRDTYKHLFDAINVNECKRQHLFLQHSATRWLARANVMKIIIEQWLELKTYFSIVCTEEKSYMARMINDMLGDNNLFIYLTITHNILIKVNVVSGLFQMNNAEIVHIYNDLYQLLLSNLSVIMKPIFLNNLQEMNEGNFKNIQNILNNELALMKPELVDFGYNFREALKIFPVNENDLSNIKIRSMNFVKALCSEICKRIPENLHVFKACKEFSIDCVLDRVKRPTFDNLPLCFLNESIDRNLLENQWHQLLSINWHTDCTTEEFWTQQVMKYKNAGGMTVFKELGYLALCVLSLPLSNAVVERVFSWMNIAKTKIRNRINLPLLDSLIRVKNEFLSLKSCCQDFAPSQRMFQKFNVSMYDQYKGNAEAIERDNNNESDIDINTIEVFQNFEDF